ncbi:trypsin-like serine peptidase [Primorskyibacter sp. 2E233]|uniref:trypsin-like serine peptidase n=1 Tax=Primorskyibacter sp. 2E233 TaxID=3413431 RepID=UPI003BF39602
MASAQQANFDVMDRRGELLGWEAVGRLDSGGGFCTATLIARDIVLTAAHCVFDQNGQPLAAERIRFRAGYHRGQSIADRRVVKWVVPDGYQRAATWSHDASMVPRDVALLRLDRAIHAAEANPFRVASAPAQGSAVSVVSYGQGRAEVLSREASCALTGHYRDGILTFDCDVTFGSSGAPVFVREDGRLRILSVISAMGSLEGGSKVALGMTLPDQVQALMARLRSDAARPIVTKGARRVGVGERNNIGARFVTPGGG